MKRPYTDYKPSGVASTGDIPSHWQSKSLGRIGSFFKGGGGTKEDEIEDGHPCIRYGDLYSWHDFHVRDSRSRISPDRAVAYTQLQYGDLLLAGSGETLEEIGKSAANLLREPAFCGGDVIICRPEGDIDATFLGYAADCSQARYQKSGMGRGVTVMHIYGSELKKLAIPVPPLEEQIQIGRFLDHETSRIDRLITMQESLIERLDEYRTALVTRVVTKGLPPEAAAAAGLDPDPALTDSGVEWLGEVPEHWEVCPLRRMLAEPLAYGANEPADIDDPSYPRYVRITDIDAHDSLRPETFRSLPPEVAAPYLLREGDLLLARSGATVGKTFLYRSDWGPCAYAGYLIRARLDTSTADTHFVRYFTSSAAYWAWLGSAYIQATIQNVSAERYANLEIALPSIHEQRAIVDYLDASTEHIDALRAKAELSIERLREYRSALVSAAVTGKIDVRDAALAGAGGFG